MPRVSKPKRNTQSQVKVFKFNGTANVPVRQHPGDAGFDLEAFDDITIGPLETKTVHTGLGFSIPEGYSGLICSRSGQASRGLVVEGGVVDRGYNGEIKVILHNTLKNETVQINKGDRIAQILFIATLMLSLVEVSELPNTERGANGFGSSGISNTEERVTRQRGRSSRSKTLPCSNGWEVKDAK